MPGIFIGIPTLNRPQLVRETLRSVLDQTCGDYTVIVSDNCSEPAASESVRRHVESLGDARVRYHLQPENVGEYGQGRFFFKAAAGSEYFMILHDDDVLKPDYLRRALESLRAHPSCACFVANPFLMDGQGRVSPDVTAAYLSEHGRLGAAPGEFDILATHLGCGFTPISGTVFRTAALRESGFVDEDCHGNYPFECNIFLRLGDLGMRGWFLPEELLGFRYHSESLRNYLKLMDNHHVVDTMIRLFARRRYRGANERRRRVVLSRLYRARALIRLRSGDSAQGRRASVLALRENVRSLKAWLLSAGIWLAPGLLRRLLPELPAVRSAPQLLKPSNPG